MKKILEKKNRTEKKGKEKYRAEKKQGRIGKSRSVIPAGLLAKRQGPMDGRTDGRRELIVK